MRKIMVVWLCAILMLSAIGIVLPTTLDSSELWGNSPLYTTHDPIYINANSNFTSENGVTGGNGTQSNPYIIEGWDINASSANGIGICNTDAYFIIRNCYVHEGSYTYDGVYFYVVQNGQIENTILSYNYGGIHLDSSSNNNISDNSVNSNKWCGIFVTYSSHTNISNNSVNTNNFCGIFLYHSSNNNIFNNSVNSTDGSGIRLDSSSNNNISNNSASNNGSGIWLYYSSNNNIIFNNSIDSNNWCGIQVSSSTYSTLIKNTLENDGIFIEGSIIDHFNTHNIDTTNIANGGPIYYYKNQNEINIDGWSAGQIILANCMNFTVKNVDCSNASVGVQLYYCEYCSVENSTFDNESYGIYLDSSRNNSISNNNANLNSCGISLERSSYNNIFNNSANMNNYCGISMQYSSDNNNIFNNSANSNYYEGIALHSSSDNCIYNNSASNNRYWHGISLWYWSNNNNISNNSVNSNNDYGIYISSSTYSTLVNNTLENNGIFIRGYGIEYYNTHNISTTNTANGKPIYYYKNLSSVDIDGWSAGQVILANCTNFTVKNVDCSNASVGVQLAYCDYCSIEDSIFNNESYGIYLDSSSSNNILSNSAKSNNWYGIKLEYSNNNTISHNNASNNCEGIDLGSSNNNSISNNNVNSNDYESIVLYSSNNNDIFNNSVTNNDHGIALHGSNNNKISDNSFNTNNDYGIYLYLSSYNNISTNSANSNNGYGIWLECSSNNTISNNHASNNCYGIYLYSTSWNNLSNNTFIFNNISYSNHSVVICNSYCKNNTFHHNNFINGSIVNVVDNGLNTKWDDRNGEGNYWSNYTGLDDGSNGRVAGDGVGDTNIPHMGLDNYPLMAPWIPPDTIPPTITNVTAIPDPQEIHGYVNISANVSDNVDVDTVWINITYPNGFSIWNFTMSYDPVNNKYYKNQTYDIVGTYQFIIWANDTSNNWNFSSGQFVIRDTAPATPTGLTVTDASSDEGGALNITWDANTELDLDHYTLYINKTGYWEVVAEIPEGTEYYVDTGLTDGTRYYYNISASDDASNESPQSATASGVPTDNLPPVTPTGLIVSDVPNDEGGVLNITWDLNTDDTVVYSLYSNKSGSWQFLVNVTHPQKWYVETGLTNNVRYYYKISAWDEVPNESLLSDAAYGIPVDNLLPATPTAVAVTSLRNGDLNITWNLNTDDTQTYSIYSNKTGIWTLLMNITHPQNWYEDSGLTSGTTYYYRISAWDEVPLESSKSGVVHGISSSVGTISGIVKDEYGNPIESADIIIFVAGNTDKPVIFYTTYSNGEYSVNVTIGVYDIKVEKSGYKTQWKKDVEVTTDQTTTIDFTLPLTFDTLKIYWLIIPLIIVIIVILIIVAIIAKKKKVVEEAEGEEGVEEVEESEIEEEDEVEEEKPR